MEVTEEIQSLICVICFKVMFWHQQLTSLVSLVEIK